MFVADQKSLKMVKMFLESFSIKYEEKPYCFGCSWDEGVKLTLKNPVKINNQPVNIIDIHEGVKFMYDNSYVESVKEHEYVENVLKEMEMV